MQKFAQKVCFSAVTVATHPQESAFLGKIEQSILFRPASLMGRVCCKSRKSQLIIYRTKLALVLLLLRCPIVQFNMAHAIKSSLLGRYYVLLLNANFYGESLRKQLKSFWL